MARPVTTTAVIDDLVSWRRRFEADDIDFRGRWLPTLSPGARWAGRIGRVRLIEDPISPRPPR